MRPQRAAVVVAATQVAAMGLVAGYHVHGGALRPDAGLRQIDALTISEPVPGLVAVDGRPTLVVVTGDLRDTDCRDQVRRALDRRDTARGLPAGYGLVLAPPADQVASVTGLVRAPRTVVRALDREVGSRLALSNSGCRPGYVVLDGSGRVRYRTRDPAWGEHSDEQRVLLGAV